MIDFLIFKKPFFFAYIINCNSIASCSQKNENNRWVILIIEISFRMQRIRNIINDRFTLLISVVSVSVVSIICGFHVDSDFGFQLSWLLTWFHVKYIRTVMISLHNFLLKIITLKFRRQISIMTIILVLKMIIDVCLMCQIIFHKRNKINYPSKI